VSGPDVSDLYKGVTNESDRIFGGSFYGDFLNWGYWKSETTDQVAACENLVGLVLGMAPRSGPSVLEAGCGIGGVARRLSRDYAQVTGINVIDDQLERCRQLLPSATFHHMNATSLEFPPGSFDDVISIEAAMHFDTRERFFDESFRVLRAGGHLLLADIIATQHVSRSLVTNVEDYDRTLRMAGFVEVRVVDVTRDVCDAHTDYCVWYLRQALAAGNIDQSRFDQGAVGLVARLAATKHYVVAAARKPIDPAPAWRADRHTNEYLSSLLIRTAGT
jgi:SAM-dependent methyltransferase